MFATLFPFALVLSRRGEASGGGGCAPVGCFLVLIGLGLVLFLIFRGRNTRQVDGAAARPMGTGPIQPHTFACPFPKCGNCGAASDKQKQQWDGLRSVTWTCGYCGNVQVQQLTDEQLPPSARQRLGLDGGMQPGAYPQGYPGPGAGGGIGSGLGGVVTGMMLGSMLGGGSHHHHDNDGWGGGSSGGSDNWDSGDSGGGWDSGGDSGGDWGGGGDSGGDWGGGGDSGGDW